MLVPTFQEHAQLVSKAKEKAQIDGTQQLDSSTEWA